LATCVDEITQLALIQASEWQNLDMKTAMLAKTNNAPNSDVLVATSSGPRIAKFIASDKPGVLRPSLRYAPLSEIQLDKTDKVGGALVFNMKGELIGIVAATLQPVVKGSSPGFVASKPARKPVTIGYHAGSHREHGTESRFTVAFAQGVEILERVIEGFRAPSRKPVHPSIGAFFRDVVGPGAMVEVVMPNSPASRGNLQVGDIVLKVNDRKIEDAIDLAVLLFRQKIGKALHIVVKRQNELDELKVVVGPQVVPK
jgi:membrane-associated protease RseP (regulator of RpoE activity)